MTYNPHPIDLSKYDVPPSVTDDTIEKLACMEHCRWYDKRYKEGWRYGEKNDEKNMTNPLMLPWEHLPESEKQNNRNQVIAAVKMLPALGYTVTAPGEKDNKAKNSECKNWEYAVEHYWQKPYNGEAEPEYSLPLIIGLIAQGGAECDFDRLEKSLKKLINNCLKEFDLDPHKRRTPVYLLSPIDNAIEKFAVDHLKKKYNIPCIRVIHENTPKDDYQGMYVVCNDPSDYISQNCYALAALWDGLNSAGRDEESKRCHTYVKKALREDHGLTGLSLENEAIIGDTRPVFNIILPSDYTDPKELHYDIRLLLPHLLENGDAWYLLDVRSDPLSDKNLQDAERRKESRYKENIKNIVELNKIISRPGKASDETVYDQLDEPVHGLSKSADSSNMRFLRLDTLAIYKQQLYRKMIKAVAWLSGIGLGAFAIMSDLGDILDIHSVTSAILGFVTIGCIIAALIIFGASRSKNLDHNRLRTLAECMRVQTYWNAVGLSEHHIDECLSTKARIEHTYALIALRAWRVIDEARGYYDEGCTDPMFIDLNVHNWLGETDIREATRYTNVGNGQLGYVRKTTRKDNSKDHRNSAIKSALGVLAIILTALFSIYIIFNVVIAARSESWSFNSISDLFTPMFESGTLMTVITNVIMVLIGLLPVIGACFIMYSATRKLPENVKRNTLLALQYQKILSTYEQYSNQADALPKGTDIEVFRTINRAKTQLLLTAGKVGISDACDWSSLMLHDDAELPF